MKVYLILFTIVSCVKSCSGQGFNIFQKALDLVSKDCKNIEVNIGLDRCDIKLSPIIIAINISPFHRLVDSLNLINIRPDEYSFEAAIYFDLKYHKESYENAVLKSTEKYENYNILLFCSDVYEGLMTCEAIESKYFNQNGNLNFGQSLLYLFKVKDSEIELLNSVIINNN